MKYILPFCLALFGWVVRVPGQTKLDRQLDSLITNRLPQVAPGCAVLVAVKGRIVYKKAFGSANLELKVAMKPDMVFRIGSMTKQYTAIAILQLVEQGKIALQDTIQKYIQEYPSKGHAITIEHLLTHTSGIPDYEALNFPIPTAIRADFPPKQIIDSLGQLPLDFTPGSKFSYSNSNYFLLAYIIERVTGKPYKDYLAGYLFRPAGLMHTYYDSPTQIIPERVSGYARYNMGYSNAGYISMTQVYGAGALMANVEDLYKWHAALCAGKLVKKETLEKAWTPATLTDGKVSQYGYGWFIKERNGSRSIEHAGGIDGFQSDGIWFQKEDVFIATLYNSLNEGGDDISFMGLDNDIATLAVGKKLAPVVRVDPAVLKEYTGVYEADADHPVVVTLENGQLQMEAKAGGLPKSPLTPKNDHVFLLAIGAEVEFVKVNGKVTKILVRFNGQVQTAKKVK